MEATQTTEQVLKLFATRELIIKTGICTCMADSVYFGDMMRTLHEILKELKSINEKLDKINSK